MHSTLGLIPTISEKDAARLLVTSTALGDLGLADALRVVGYMKPKRIKEETVFIREGEKDNTDFMMLILSGDARVESSMPGGADNMIVGVIGAGHLLGEMALLNGSARSATCIATSELAVAVLTRTALKRMMAEESDLAARFLLAVSGRTAERLLDTTAKLKKFIQLTNMLQKEVHMLMDSQDQPKPAVRGKGRAYAPTEPAPLNFLDQGGSVKSSKRVKLSGLAKL